MQIIIHRGINQIGGCITEIQSSSGTKILIDLGHNLPDADGQAEDEYDVPENLDRLLDGVSAVFYTHYHGDHIAFEAAVAKKVIDQYLGHLARKVKLKFYAHMKNVPQEESSKKFEAAFNAVLGFTEYYPTKAVTVGDIRITPYYLSHSAADAYMFVIECDGRKVLHTGDFRDHGYIGKWLYGTLRKFVVKPKTDVLITEGTMISRGDERMMSEKELQDKAYGLMSDYKYAFVLCSSTDPDRLASFCQATIRHPGRMFIADGYQCKMLDLFTKNLYQKRNIRTYDFSKAQEYDESLFPDMIESGFTMLVRTSGKFKSLLDNFMRILPDKETVFIYSQFNGYIRPEHKAYKADTDEFVHSHGWKFECLHTSGHASQETLAKVCNIVNPSAAIIPIHKEDGSDFKSLDIDDALKDKVVEHNTIVDGIEIQVQ